MPMTHLRHLFCAVVLMASASAHAASIFFVYTGDNPVADDGVVTAQVGDVIHVDLMMDFSGPNEATLGGNYDISYDADAFEFLEFTSAGFGDPVFGRDPDFHGPGYLFAGGFGSFDGLTGPARVASLTFRVQDVAEGRYSMSPTGSQALGGPFISAIDFVTVIDPNFIGLDIDVVPVPLPAAGLLFGSGLIALGCARIRRRDAVTR